MTNDDRTLRRCLCVAVDMAAYGPRDDRRQYVAQADLVALLDAAAIAAELDRDAWTRQPQGDGEMALLPAGEPGVRVLDDYVAHLHSALRHHNDDRSAATAIRLRMAVHHGVVRPADNGFAGATPVLVGRLLDSAPLRAALAASADAPLAVLVSDPLYRDLVAAGHTVVRPGEFQAVTVVQKEVHERAWLRVPGVDVHGIALPAAESPIRAPSDERSVRAAPSDPAGSSDWPGRVGQDAAADGNGMVAQAGRDVHVDHSGDSVTNTFADRVDARGATFGFSVGSRERE